MKTATVLLIPNKYKTETSAIKGDKIVGSLGIVREKNKAGLSLIAEHAIAQQANDIGMKVEIRHIGKDDTPRNVSTDLVIILDEKNFIPPDYLEKVNSAASLFSFAVLCGPVTNHIQGELKDWFREDIAIHYRSYQVDMYNASSLNVTSDLALYPSIYNTIFTKKAYNEIGGYSSLKGNKLGTIWDNRILLTEAGQLGDITYCKDLGVKYVFNEDELSNNAIMSYFYKLGFLDGIIQPEDKKEDVVWQKYVNNSERFDYSMPMWVAMKDSIPDEDKKKEYAHKLAAFRTIYNVGFFEGLEGVAII